MAPSSAAAGNGLAFAAVLAIALALALTDPDARTPSGAPGPVFSALSRAAGAPLKGLSFALGSNVCLDSIVQAAHVLGLPPGGPPPPAADLGFLATADDVRAAFLHFFAAGAAAERSAAGPVLDGFVAAAQRAPSLRNSLGGNAALIARRLAVVAPTAKAILLGGHVGPGAAALLPSGVTLASPAAPTDEVHLILEYARGEELAGLAAPRANRFIVTADAANSDAAAMLATIAAADALPGGVDSLTVAGLHMLEPLPAAGRTRSLAAIAAALSARRVRAPVHIELASCADAGFMAELARTLFPLAASVGFNEQEGAFLFEALGGTYGGGRDSVPSRGAVASATAPQPSAVARLLRFVFEAFPPPGGSVGGSGSGGGLSRLHFHSLAFHVIGYRKAAVGATWRGTAGAVAAGSVAATTQACGLGSSPAKLAPTAAAAAAAASLSLLAPASFSVADPRGAGPGDSAAGASSSPPANATLSSAAPVASWLWASAQGPLAFRLAPVAVCAAPLSTVGLGDAISASALAADATLLRA